MSLRRKIRRLLILVSTLFLVSWKVAGSAQTADAILGEWYSPDKDGKFLFYKSGGNYYGKIIWLKEPKDEKGNVKLDTKNPDPAKRKNTMMGLIVFKDFKWSDKEKMWVDGKVYDARSGDTWSCELSLSSSLVLEVHGYLVFSWLGKSAYFSRY
jgi:uncharacterized protein (DUF2147 family)